MTDRSRLRRVASRFAGLARQDGGMAAVEFALILPILVVLWIGGVEVTQALSIDRRVNNLASAVGDLVSRSKIVTDADVDKIFDIAPGAMFPYCRDEAECSSEGLGMRVSAINISSGGDASVAWSRGQGSTAYTIGAPMNSVVPVLLRVPDTQIIVSEIVYTYRPAVGYVITGDLVLDDRMFFVPRLVAKVQLCQSSPPPTNCVS